MHLIRRLTSEENREEVGYLYGAWYSIQQESHFHPDILRTQVLHGQFRDCKSPSK